MPASAPLVAASRSVAQAPAAPPPQSPLPIEQPAWGDHLWGAGLATPGGAEAIMRLAALLPLSPATTLLLVGRGATAAGNIVAEARGAWVAAHDTEAEPTPPPPPAIGRREPPQRVEAAKWTPIAPSFRPGRQNHALLLEPFRDGAAPPRLLPAVAAALRPGAQIVLFDLVARDGAAIDPGHSRWLRMERRGSPPSERAAVAAFSAAGFQTHVVQDEGAAHAAAVLQAWTRLLRVLSESPSRPTRLQAAALVAEAEAWLLRLRLIESGALRLLRWHGSLR
ncbi:hypothetical protein [Plastoroseomonas hellenica]|uniref:hypothetical protein n=1 Tax=Plastoroseomonas hellenica TaxID=2687306 RepID=UPI001BAD7669|nr:hypothetical protein [Plastoroseomonas hellenica]MBR0644156.1 hypothetical protein [Plastoroseomonas hellenica]